MEYLLTDMPVSAPITPVSTFAVLEGDRKHFPVENRLLESSLQDFNSFAHYMNQFRSAPGLHQPRPGPLSAVQEISFMFAA